MSTIQVTNINDLSDNAALVTDNGGIKTDKLTGKTTAGSISIVGEGNSTTTNLQQGLVKAWAETNGSGTTIRDSFNIASLEDTASGRHTCNYANDFASDNNTVVTTGQTVGSNMVFSSSASGSWIVYSFNGTSYGDMAMSTIAAGDLA